MKQRLIILSDLWGKQRANYLDQYLKLLDGHFEIQFYDVQKLGALDKHLHSKELIHQQFVSGGTDIAVQRLAQLEKGKIDILAFSIGGSIAWKACLNDLNVEQLYAVSSTRLRYEPQRLDNRVKLYYGALDQYRPSIDWLEKMRLDYHIIPNQGHLIYHDPEFAKMVCKTILTPYL